MLRRKMGGKEKRKAQADAPAASEDDTGAESPPATGTDGDADPAQPSEPPAAVPSKRKRTRAKGKGWRPLPDHLPKVPYQGTVCACAHCGSKRLVARDREERSRLDAAAVIAQIRKELLQVKLCKDCGRTTTAEPPSLPCPKSRFTCGFLAWLVTMKFVLLVPLNRIRRLLDSQGIYLAKSTLVRLIELAATLAQAIDGAHWSELKKADCLLTDGTGLKVLIEGLPKVWHAVLDVFTRNETTVYQFALTKHGDELAAMLRKFEGPVMCDAESRLNELCEQVGVLRANCNAHPRRKFRDAEKYHPILAKQAGRFLTRMYAVERRAKKEGLTGDALLARRQAETRPIARAFKAWLFRHSDLLPTDPLGKVIAYYLRHFDDLTRFVGDARIPIDNNQSERAFQDHARLRFNSLFAGSPEGGHRWAILLGVVTTAKRHGLDVQAYLTWMFERRGTRKREFGFTAEQLTPAAYKKMLEERRESAAA
jgi:transposase